ncbi:hypothetical protein CLU79DRAFT_732890 [Phycomyces nitens]|nr:hypothetical protein CLU79DRAFT_732890 [Phycomyces nitens]
MAHSTKKSNKTKPTTSSSSSNSNSNNNSRKRSNSSSPSSSQSPSTSQYSQSTPPTFPSLNDEPASKRQNTGQTSDYDDRSSRSTSQSTPRSRISVQRSVPAFLNKLYNMVEDEATNDLIRWSVDGASFTVEQHEEFAKSVLPRFYKHNTFASFVRQLNMYDFHKVPHPQQGILLAENDRELWEFSNPHFQRGRPNLLVRVTRKRNRDRERNRDRDTAEAEQVNLASLVKDITAIRKHQTTISSELHDLHRDNEILWQETLSAREKHQRHQDVIQKILQFLTTAFNSEQAPIDMSKHAQFMLGEHNEYIRVPQNKPLVQNMVPIESVRSERVVEGYSGEHNTHQQAKGLIKEAASLAGMVFESTLGVQSQTAESPAYNPPEAFGQPIPADLGAFSETLNTATRSAQAISQDIDDLQLNIEALAADIGIDASHFQDLGTQMDMDQFTDDYSEMITSASRRDRIDLYELAGGSFVKSSFDQVSSQRGKIQTHPNGDHQQLQVQMGQEMHHGQAHHLQAKLEMQQGTKDHNMFKA